MGTAPTALLLFSHGSVLCGASRILRHHAERLRGDEFPVVEMGFLNYSEPSFEEAVERCRASGAARVVIVPYFLVAGRFVTHDLPPRIDAARARHPDIEFKVADALLDAPELSVVILDAAAKAVPVQQARHAFGVPVEDCEQRRDCPLFETPACPRNGAAR